MLKSLLSFFIILFSIKISIDKPIKQICESNPIYCQIVKNNPKINKNYAMKISNIIYYVAQLYNIDPKKYAAILAQESMYKLNAKNCNENKCLDFGISQINHKTARMYGFDLNKLTNDLHYSIRAGAIVLSDLNKVYGNKEPNWWSRYNSSKKQKRDLYVQLVLRYM